VLPQARIVVDKFHVVRMANDALERVRKGLRKELKPSQSRTLKGDRKILLKRAHEVSDRERLIMETWTGAFPQLLAAYTTKHKKKAPTAKVSPFYKKTIGYGLPDFAEELNYGVDLSTI
jgi:transposase